MADKRCRPLQTTKINQTAKNKSPCGAQPHQICLNIIALKAQGSQWMWGWKDCKNQNKKQFAMKMKFLQMSEKLYP